MDDDKRSLRLYQERYLADGDLHSDGPGRARRFRWKNIGEPAPPHWNWSWSSMGCETARRAIHSVFFLFFLPDDVFNADQLGTEGDGEEQEDEEVDLSEVQRRRERLEREQWLREQVAELVGYHEEPLMSKLCT